jgi:hypothetical protein
MNAQALERLHRHRQELSDEIRRRRNVSTHFRNLYPQPIARRYRTHENEGYTYEYLYERIRRKGIHVRTHVKWLSPYVEHDAPPWEPQPENPLLAITLEPEPGNYFPTQHTKYPGEPYHVSIAYLNDLTPRIDLYVYGGVIHHLLDRFENKTHHLVMDPTKDSTETGLQLDPERDPIATDDVLQLLKSLGRYRHRPWHITL